VVGRAVGVSRRIPIPIHREIRDLGLGVVGVMVGDQFVCCYEEIFRLSLVWVSWFIRPWTACWLWHSLRVLVYFLSGLDLFPFPFIIMLLSLRGCTSLFFLYMHFV
jgi:hypothetical protein